MLLTPAVAFMQKSGFQGPGDIVASWDEWWGLRGYSAAYAAPGNNPAIDVVDAATGLITTTCNILATGALDVATILGLGYAVKVKKLYDQSGNAKHLSQATLAAMPALTLSGLGALPVMTFAGGQTLKGTITGHAQPYCYSLVGRITGNTGATQTIMGETGINIQIGFNTGGGNDNTWYQYAGGGAAVAFAAADATPHAVQSLFNDPSSSTYCDGSSTVTNSGSNALGTAFSLGEFTGFGQNMTGFICECGIKNSDYSASFSSMNSNQHAYWVF